MTDLAKVIDYTLLKPAITADEIKRFCRRARLDVYSLEKWSNQIAHHTPNIEITIQKILQLITGCTTPTGQAEMRIEIGLGLSYEFGVGEQTQFGRNQVRTTRYEKK